MARTPRSKTTFQAMKARDAKATNMEARAAEAQGKTTLEAVKARIALTNIEELKARSQTEWLSHLNLMETNPLGACLWRTQCNINADLVQCKTTMSPKDYTACLEYALYDYIPRVNHPSHFPLSHFPTF